MPLIPRASRSREAGRDSRRRPLRAGLVALLLVAPGGESLATDAPGSPTDAAPARLAATDSAQPEKEPSAPAAKPDAKLVEKGRRTYRDFCQKCHGLNMVSTGGGFFDLRTFPPDQKPRFVNSVTNGKRAMPAWGSILKADEIEALWAYVSTGAGKR